MGLSSALDERGFIRLSLEGPWPAKSEILSLHRSLGNIADSRRLLIDFRLATSPLPMFAEIRDLIASFDTKSAAAQSRKRAMLVASDVQFGIARSFQAIVPGQMEVFRDEAAAIEWLLE